MAKSTPDPEPVAAEPEAPKTIFDFTSEERWAVDPSNPANAPKDEAADEAPVEAPAEEPPA